MTVKQVTYEDYHSLSGTSALDITAVLDLFYNMYWQDGAFLYFEINAINTLQIMHLREEQFLIEITNDSEHMIFHQKYGDTKEARSMIQHFYANQETGTLPGFYEVPINEKTLDQVMQGK